MEVSKQVFESKVKLNKGITGSYGWEITLYGDDENKMVVELERIDSVLKGKFRHEDNRPQVAK